MTINYAYIIIAFAISLVFSLICTPIVVKMCNTHGILKYTSTVYPDLAAPYSCHP